MDCVVHLNIREVPNILDILCSFLGEGEDTDT